MWCLSFAITYWSKWVVRLSIGKDSPSTWVSSSLIIDEVPSQSSVPTEASLISDATPSAQSASGEQENGNGGKPKSSIKISLLATRDELTTWSQIETELANGAALSLQYE